MRAARAFFTDFVRYSQGSLKPSRVRNASPQVRRLLERTPLRVATTGRGRVRVIQFFEREAARAGAQTVVNSGGRPLRVAAELRRADGRWDVTRVRVP